MPRVFFTRPDETSVAWHLIKAEFYRSSNAWEPSQYRANLRHLLNGYALPRPTQYQLWQLRQSVRYLTINATSTNTNTNTESESDMDNEEEMIECAACNDSLNPEDATIINDEAYHESCTVSCDNCGDAVPDGDQTSDGRTTLCESCYDSDYITCEDCDHITHIDNYTSVGGDHYVCESCLGNGDYHYCEDSGEYLHGDERDCEYCGASTEHIHNYGYKPDPLFHDSRDFASRLPLANTVYYGIELETTPRRGNDCGDASEHLASVVSEDVLYQKEDGSISNGFEIVTHPMTLDWAMMNFPWNVLSELSDRGMNAWNDSRCGLHIHISRTAFRSQTHLAKFLLFIYRNENDMVKFTGRRSHYADFSIYERHNFVNNAKGSRVGERHVAVNCRNDATVELRVFRPSLKATTVQAYIQFCDALVTYTNHITTQDCVRRNALSFEAFTEWVSTIDQYSVLHERIVHRLTNA
jgi:hypothetical protein